MKIDDILPFELTPEQAIAILASLAAFGTVCAVWSALLARNSMGVRAKRLRQRQEELKAGLTAPHRKPERTVTAIGVMQAVTQRLNLLRSQAAGTIAERLARAGWRSKDAVVTFLFMKMSLPFVFGASAFAVFNVLGFGNLSEIFQQLLPIAAVCVGAYAPDIFVKNAIQKREVAVQKGLPDTLDLLVICAEAGLSLDAALSRVAKEMERSAPDIAEEFGITSVELGFLPDRRKALENLVKRCQIPSIRGVVNTLMQTEKYGTPLANSLRALSAEFRNERMLKAEEKAARLPAIMTVPMILFILPALFIVLMGPAILRAVDAFTRV